MDLFPVAICTCANCWSTILSGHPGQHKQTGAFSTCCLESGCYILVLHFFIAGFSVAYSDFIYVRTHTKEAYKGANTFEADHAASTWPPLRG